MSRVSHAIKNMKFSMFFYLIFLVLQFVSRKLFLDNLGDEFMGLSGTLRSFLSFLNLAELGIGAAVGFSLYKPIFNKPCINVHKGEIGQICEKNNHKHMNKILVDDVYNVFKKMIKK
jgi:hypothetical protein